MKLKLVRAKNIKFGDKIFFNNQTYIQYNINFEDNKIYFYNEENYADRIVLPICTLYGGDNKLNLIINK